MRIRTLAALGLMVLGIGAVVFVTIGPSLTSSSSSTRYITTQAAVTDVVDQVSATGTVSAVATYSFAFGSAPSTSSSSTASSSSSSSASSSNASGSGSSSTSWNVTNVLVKVGNPVKQGDTLATADDASAQLAVTVANANLASANSKLKTDKAGITAVDKATAKLQVTQANQQLANARTSYTQTVRQNNLKITQQDAALARAKKQLADDTAAKQPANVITQDNNAIIQQAEALQSLKLQVAQSNLQASQSISSAKLSVQSANYAYQTKVVPPVAATIQSDEAAIAQAQQSLDTAQTTLKYATLVTPVDGIVTAVNIVAGAGAPSGTAITIRTTDLEVTGSVAEADLPSIQLAQDATVTLTALATSVTGKVVSVDQNGTSSGTGSVVSYGIIVSLPKPPAGVAPGMSAQISITTQSATGVLAVPAIALQRSSGQYTVRVLDATGQPQSVPVTVGLVTSSLAEIKSGLNEGQPVVTGTSSARQGTTTTTTTGIPGLGGGGGFGGGGGGGFGGRGTNP